MKKNYFKTSIIGLGRSLFVPLLSCFLVFLFFCFLFPAHFALAADPIYKTSLVSQSHTLVNLKPDAAFTFTLKFKNEGDSTWVKKTVYLKSLTTALKFRHSFWPDPYLPATLAETEVAPGGVGTFVFALQAPGKLGNYSGDFVLVDDNILISGGAVIVALNVVEDPSAVVVAKPNEPITTTPPAPTVPDNTPKVCTLQFRTASVGVDNESCVAAFNLPASGPLMRVGIYYTDDIITVINTKAWQVLDKDGTLLASVSPGVPMNFFYNDATGEYSFDFIDHTIRTASYLSLKNFEAGMFTITSYHDIPSYSKKTDFNDFVGDLEIRHNDSKDRTWVIEIIPIEEYLKGMMEVSNPDPMEYLKTMAIAARTYALYHYDRYTKHGDEFFHVDADYDQVYKGYVASLFLPRLAEAIDATRGIVATYANKVIVAAYYAHSDGRTRSALEVWKNEVPYLQSKVAPYSAGKSMYGHGVGIDAMDAKSRAKNDGWTYDQLLKYYYTGIAVEKIY
jgi:hypothetical protein